MKKLYLFFPEKLGYIAPGLYGYFIEHLGGVIYDGIWVGKDSPVPNINGFRTFLIEKLKSINPPVLRWPGGCTAELYDWRDGIGDCRPTRISWWTYRDGRYEPNTVGIHEFIDFCELTGASPYIAANIASATPQDMRNWIDYCLSPRGKTTLALEREKNGHGEPFPVSYWGIGNENWGAGGDMQGEEYARRYRRYAMFIRNAFPDIKLIACGPDGGGGHGDSYQWTRNCLEVLKDAYPIHRSPNALHGFALHYYPRIAGDSLNFSRDQWYQFLKEAQKMDELIRRYWSIICGFGMEKFVRLAIDEWGAWHPDGSGPSKGANLWEQQSTMRDALTAALTLNIFNNHCDKIMMANIAHLVNCLQSLFLSSGEHCIVTPNYHVFDMYKNHQGAEAIRAEILKDPITFINEKGKDDSIDDLSVSASHKDGYATITIVNLNVEQEKEIMLESIGAELEGPADMVLLTHEDYHACNTFETPDTVTPIFCKLDVGKKIILPKASVASIRAKIDFCYDR
jgi:alpha-N-arabinofuranosidase